MIKLIHRKIGRGHKFHGYAYRGVNLIEIDPRQTPREAIDTVIHECLHCTCPLWTEDKVRDVANEIAAVLWEDGYRRIKK
jgi:hypothetical protein